MTRIITRVRTFRAHWRHGAGFLSAVLLAWYGLGPVTGYADTTSTVLAADFVTYIQDKTLTVAYKATRMEQFGFKGNLERRNSKSFQYTRYERLPLPQTALIEGVTPASTTMSISTVTATVDQWGQVVVITDMAELVVKHPVVQKATQLLGLAAAETRDREIQKVLQAGTNVQMANSKAARPNLVASDVLTTAEVRKAVANLRNNGAIPGDTDDLMGVLDPSVEMDVSADATWVAAQQYSNVKALFNGEAGKWMGVRWLRSNFLGTFTGIAAPSLAAQTVGGTIPASTTVYIVVTGVDNNTGFESLISQQGSQATGAGTNTNIIQVTAPATAGYTYNVYAGLVTGTTYLVSTGVAPSAVSVVTSVPGSGTTNPPIPATGVVVHASYVFGNEAFAIVGLDGMSLQTYVSRKESSDSDPLEQRRKVGWKMAFKSVICNNSFMRRIESGSAY